MKKLLIIPFFFFSLSVFGQFTKPELYNGINLNIRNKGASQKRLADMLDSIVVSMGTGGGSMVYPGAGIPLSTGSAWGTSITDNSADWNDALRIGATQTNTAAKTFNNATLLMRNVADTYSSYFTNTNTAARTYTLPDASGKILLGDATTALSSITGLNLSNSALFSVDYTNTTSLETISIGNGSGGITLSSDDTGAGTSQSFINLNQSTIALSSSSDQYISQINWFYINDATAVYEDGKTVKDGIKYAFSGYETDDLSLTSRGYVNSGTATLTNKTAALGSNTISGTKAEFNTAVTDGNVMFMDGTNTTTGNMTVATAGSNNIELNFLGGGSGTGGLTVTANGTTPITLSGEVDASFIKITSSGAPGGSSAFNMANQTVSAAINGDGWLDNTGWHTKQNSIVRDYIAIGDNIAAETSKVRYPTRTQSGTSYTLQASDENYIIHFTDGGAIAVTLPNGLSTNFSCTLWNDGGGVITIAAATTLHSTATTIETQYTGAGVQHVGSNVWEAAGALGSAGGGSGDVVGPSSSVAGTLALFDGTTGKLLKEAVSATNRVTSDGGQILFEKVSSVTGNNLIRASNGGAGENHAMGLLLLGGNASGSNYDGGDVIIQSGNPHGSGAKGAVQIADSADKLGFFEVTPVVKQSAPTTAQGIADVLTAYGLIPTSTISGGGGSGLTYSQVSALSVIGN